VRVTAPVDRRVVGEAVEPDGQRAIRAEDRHHLEQVALGLGAGERRRDLLGCLVIVALMGLSRREEGGQEQECGKQSAHQRGSRPRIWLI
jgi:hypothetical protein